MNKSGSHKLLWLRSAMLASVGPALFAHPAARAQSVAPAEVRSAIDENGVDLFDGTFQVSAPAVTLGSSENGLAYQRVNRGAGWTDSTIGYLNLTGSEMIVSIGSVSDRFTLSGGVYTATEGNGSALTISSNTYTYTRSDGTVAHFDATRFNSVVAYGNKGLISDITTPDGHKLTYTYSEISYCSNYKMGSNGYICMVKGKGYRLSRVTSSYGYEIKPSYSSFEYFYDPFSPEIQPDWGEYFNVIGATGHNRATSATTTLRTQTFSRSYESGASYYNVSNDLSQTTKYRMTGAAVTGIKRPGSSSEDVTVTYTSGKVTALTTPNGTTSYARSDAGGSRTVTVTDPLSHASTYVFDIATRRMSSFTSPLGKTTSYLYDGSGRLTRITAPEGNQVRYTYDARGNVTEQRYVAKSSGSPPDIVVTAGYDTTCSNPVTCNQPNWTKDALGNQTDYTYNSNHGGALTVTAPAATSGAARPQTRYSYTSLQAYYDQGSGSPTASGTSTWRLTGTSTCLTGSTCTGTADEAVTTVSYGPQASGTGNNLHPVSITRASGNNAISATTTIAYDAVGNATSVDGPLSGAGDTTAVRYDALRRQVGAIGPDPDGAGSLPNIASRVTYDTNGRATLTEEGTTAGQSDTAWSGFTAGAGVARTYSAADQVLTETLQAGSTAYSLTQYSYDADGRLACAAQRMNPSTWSSLPSSACTLTTAGSYGPDRITKTTYDNADRATLVQSAYGTSDQADEVTSSYTDNGKLAYVVDGEANRTTYEYDGHDRLVKTRYPVATKGSNTSSTTDYEELTFGDNVRVTQRRLRDGNTIAFGYDNLSRLTSMTGSTIDNRSITYNLLGNPLVATLTASSQTITHTWDALGRLTSQAVPQGTMSYAYDAASRRTRITWPDSFYADYDYDAAGRVTAIRENGATSGVGVLASYSYDSLGRRASVSYGNGTSRTYAVDAPGRLTGLSIDLSSTSGDIVIGQVGGSGSAITYNPASQIASLTKSNDAYAWTGHVNVDRDYVANGLNQYTSVRGSSLSYDSRGNLTSSGGVTYTYDGLNLLTGLSGSMSASLAYDPAGRLYQLTTSGGTSRFIYDGGMIAGEYNGSNTLLRRFVPGPRVDEPVVWYEGSGTSERRFLQGDERGSIIAVSNASGAPIAINTYDEYGIPGASSSGRFQYTGQVWLPEIGLYYYKARMYSPTLGRFMQTDPIGYGDGMNLYNYVGGDPVNGTDPSGLTCLTNSERCGPPIVVTGFRDPCGGVTCVTGDAALALKQRLDTMTPGPNSTIANVFLEETEIIVRAAKKKAKPQNEQCFGPPAAPGTGSTQSELAAKARSNAREASSHYWDPLNVFWFRSKVKNNGAWDYKQDGSGYEDFGNYNYGRAGAAMGLATDFLLGQAGRAQQAAGTSRPEWGDPGFLGYGGLGGTGSYGDDPHDQEMIRRGISDQRNGC